MTNRPRTVLITGASTGIGECAAHRLDRLGWRVFAGVRREEDGARVAANASDRLQWVLLDVTDPRSIASAVDTLRRQVAAGGLDALVNNAGIAVGSPLEFVDLEALRRQFEVNVFGLVAVTQACLPLLRSARGRIVNIGSVSGRVAAPMVGPYSASKHAVEAISDVLRMELAPAGIETSLIEPGSVRTPIWEKGARSFDEAKTAFPAEAFRSYQAHFHLMEKVVRRGRKYGIAPERVADSIVHALTARKPRHRYLIGRDARIRFYLQNLLPRRWMDGLVQRMIRKHGTPAA